MDRAEEVARVYGSELGLWKKEFDLLYFLWECFPEVARRKAIEA